MRFFVTLELKRGEDSERVSAAAMAEELESELSSLDIHKWSVEVELIQQLDARKSRVKVRRQNHENATPGSPFRFEKRVSKDQ